MMIGCNIPHMQEGTKLFRPYPSQKMMEAGNMCMVCSKILVNNITRTRFKFS